MTEKVIKCVCLFPESLAKKEKEEFLKYVTNIPDMFIALCRGNPFEKMQRCFCCKSCLSFPSRSPWSEAFLGYTDSRD